jgi:glucokinase
MILAGDIGGTKVNLALFEVADRKLILGPLATYRSRDYSNLEEMVRAFLTKHQLKVDYACFGVAGVVRNDRAKLTNLTWTVDASELNLALNLKQVWLVNDLEANAYGFAGLEPDDFVLLNRGEEAPDGNRAIISAGTGLGEGGLLWDGSRRVAIASEGGHADFAPRTDLDVELLRYLRTKLGQVSWEHILSGRGFVRVYEFLRDTGRGAEPDWLTEQCREQDPAIPITRAGLESKSDLCVQTVELFVHYYGAEAGNLALKMLATGGMYIGGGIAPKLIAKMKDGAFMRAFIGEGRMKDVLAAMPVRVIMNDKTALIGAARYAAMQKGRFLEEGTYRRALNASAHSELAKVTSAKPH